MLKNKYIYNTYELGLKILLGVIFLLVFVSSSYSQVNVVAASLTTSGDPYPEEGMCPSTGKTLQVKIVNTGTVNLNVVSTPVTITITISGPVNQSFSTVLNTGNQIIPGGSRYVNVTTTGDFSLKGEYSVALSATCSGDSSPGIDITETLTIEGNKISLTSAPSTTAQTVCLNSSISSITYELSGNSSNAIVTGLPAGINANLNYPILTISGSPSTLIGSPFSYSVTSTGACPASENQTLNGSMIVKALPVISIVDKTNDTLTCNDQLFVYNAVGGNSYTWSTGATTSNISVSTPGKYLLTGTANGCSNKDSIDVKQNITPPASPVGSDVSRCGPGSVNLSVTSSPNTSVTWYAADKTTIKGAGLNYTSNSLNSTTSFFVEAKNTNTGCVSSKTEVKAIIIPLNTASSQSTIPTLCVNTSLTPITHTTTGATGIGTATGLPAGITASWASNTITISGTPTVAGVFNYTIPLTGGCGTVDASGTITVTSANTAGSPSTTPTLCINTALTSITHTTTGATGIGIPTGLPDGVTASWASNKITISGTPTNSGTFNYTIPLTGGCGTIVATGTITVSPDNTFGLASSTPTLCINTALTPITLATTGATGIGSVTGLPNGVTASWASNTITISGTPTNSGVFNYSIPLTGGCGSINALGTFTVSPNNTTSLASTTPTLCINTVLTPINHTTTGATGIGTATGLPAGVTAAWASNKITISGTPTVAGVFNYKIPLTGGCGTVEAEGTITVISANTVSAATSAPTLCINTILAPINHTTTGATGIGVVTGLPAGVTTNWSSNTITISGTPTEAGVFNYTIPLTGGCSSIEATGTITVSPLNTVGAASSSPTLCINTALTPITHTTTGATGIGTVTGLPTGLTASWASNKLTISGTPTNSGTFNYKILLTGGCGSIEAVGVIKVTPENTASTVTSKIACLNVAMTSFTHTTTGATGIGTATGLPTGVIASWASNTITISGTPTNSGVFNYTIPLTGGCGLINATGTITVSTDNTSSVASANPTLCANSLLTPITHTTTGATGIGAATGLPTGVTANWSSNTITISGNPTNAGVFNYSIPLTGGCGSIAATGTITVLSTNTVTAASTTSTICINTVLSPITHTTTGATGIGAATGLPSGVTASWSSNTITISGSPTKAGVFDYSIPLTGGCGSVIATGKIIVTQDNVAGVASSLPSLCINTALTPITHTTTGATGIGLVTGLPAGVTASWSSNKITISGTPTEAGVFQYKIPLTGGCGAVNATGEITVNSIPKIENITGKTNLCIDEIDTLNSSTVGGQWSSSSPLIASIDKDNGTITAIKKGSVDITYTVVISGCSNFVKTKVNVYDFPTVANIIGKDSLCEGDNLTLTNTTIDGVWSSDNSSIASVVNGVVTGKSAGKSKISYTVTKDGCATEKTLDIIVNSYPDVLPITGVSDLCVGSSIQLSNTQIGVWSSSNDAIASINAFGLVTGKSAGTVTINYKVKNANCSKSVTANITVKEALGVSSIIGNTNICIGSNSQLSNATKGGTWSSSNQSVATVNSSGLVSSISIGTTTIRYDVVTNGVCPQFTEVTFNVSEIPTVNTIEDITVCNGSLVNPINFTGTGSSVVYHWAKDKTEIGLDSIGKGDIKSFTATGTSIGGGSKIAIINVTPISNGCAGKSKSFTITVNPLDNAGFSYSSPSFCELDANPSPIISGLLKGTFTSSSKTDLIVNDSTGLVNLAASKPGYYKVTYKTKGSCPNDSTIDFAISSTPSISSISNRDQQVCDGSSFDAINFSGSQGTIFNWTNDNTDIGLAKSGIGNIPSFIASGTKIGGSPIVAKIIVIPTSGSCVGVKDSFLLTVKPKDDASFTYQSNSFCKNVDADPVATNITKPGGTFTISPSGAIFNANTGLITLSSSNSNYYAVTYTTNGSCKNSQTINLAIGEGPSVDIISDQTICSGSAFNDINFIGTPGTIFNWSSSNSALIGLASSGTGNIPSFIGSGATSSIPNISSTITVIPSVGSCKGSQQTFKLEVKYKDEVAISYASSSFCNENSNQLPTITGVKGGVFSSNPTGLIIDSITGLVNVKTSSEGVYNIQYKTSGSCGATTNTTLAINNTPSVGPIEEYITVCSGMYFSTINFTGTPGTIYQWTNSKSSIGLPISGVGDILSFKGINNGNVTDTAIITVTPISGACKGEIKSFKLIVKPSEDATFSYTSSPICQNGNNLLPTIAGKSGGTFTSSVGLSLIANTGEINLKSSKPGTYDVIYKTSSNECYGIKSYTLTINSIPVVDTIKDMFKCQGYPFDPISFSGTIGASFSWVNSNTSIGLNSSGKGNISSFTAKGTSLGSDPLSSVVTVTPTINGCDGMPLSFILTTNSLENPGFEYSSNSYCFTEKNPIPTITGKKGGTFSVLPSSGLIIDPSSGTLDLSSASAGVYKITYSLEGFCKVDSSINISVGTAPLVKGVLDQVRCQGSSFDSIIFKGSPGTVYEWINLNSNVGLASSGTGDISSFKAIGISTGITTDTIIVNPKIGACIGIKDTFLLTVKPLDNASFSYERASFCKKEENPKPTVTGFLNGTFTSTPVGLSMVSDGTINLATSTSGEYKVSYTTHGECPNVFTIPLSIGTQPSVDIVGVGTDPDQTVCLGSNFSEIKFTGSPGTVFNWVNDNNNTSIGLGANGIGNISPFKAIGIGSATIKVTPIIGTCQGNPKFINLTVNNVQTSSINYNQSSYCNIDSDPKLIQTGPTGGSYTASPSGLSIDENSGLINLKTSKTGHYTVKYELNAQCSTSSFTKISIAGIPTVDNVLNDSICNGFTFQKIDFKGSDGTQQFTWTNSNTSIGLASSGTIGIPTFKAINNGSSYVTSEIEVTPKAGSCTGNPMKFKIVVKPSDNSNFSYAKTNFCNSDPNPTPNLAISQKGFFSSNPTGLNLNSSTGIIDVVSSKPGTYNVTFLTKGVCPQVSTQEVLINPVPFVNKLPDVSQCQGFDFELIQLAGSIHPTIFEWKNEKEEIGLGKDGIGIIPKFTAIGTTKNGENLSSNIIVTPKINGCLGKSDTFKITVNSLDDAGFNYEKYSICQNDSKDLFDATVPSNKKGEFSATPLGLSLNKNTGQITRSTSTVGKYLVKFKTIGSCPDDSIVSVTINPDPKINTITNQNQEKCFGDLFDTIVFTGTSVDKFKWTNDNILIGLKASGEGNITAFTAKGTVFGGSALVGNIKVTPEINGCLGTSQNIKLTVNPIDNPAFHYSDNSFCKDKDSDPVPIIDGTKRGKFTSTPNGLSIVDSTGLIKLSSSLANTYKITYTTPGKCKDDSTISIGIGSNPTVDDVDDQSYCQGDMFDPVLFKGNPGTVFEWVNDNPAIGLDSMGTGSIKSFKGTGTIDGGLDAISKITVLPRIGSCKGPIVNYKYKVRANPKILANIVNTSKKDTSVCKGSVVNLNATGAAKNELYVWTPHTSLVGNIGIGASVTTKSDTTQQFIVRGQSLFGCYNYDTLNVKVYSPMVNQKSDTTVCAATLINSIPLVSKLVGTTFEWNNNNTSIGLGSNGTGNITSFTSKNTTNSLNISIITVTPKYTIQSINKTCIGPNMTFKIRVNKEDSATFNGYSGQYCANETLNTIPKIKGSVGGVFSSRPLGLAIKSNTGEIYPMSSKPGGYTVKYTTSGVCPKSDSTYLFINPLITASISGADTVCLNAISPKIKFKGSNGVAPYIFKYKLNGGIIQSVSTDPGQDEVYIPVPTNKSGIFTYELISVEESSSSQCKNSNVFGIQSVIVNELPVAQITTTSTSVCTGGISPEIRITGINGVSPFTFTYFISKDGNPFGSSQNVSTTQGQFLAKIPVNTTDPGVYNYTVNVVKNGDDLSCFNNINISQTVTIKPLPTGFVTATPTGVCMNGNANIEFTASNGIPPFTFVYSINNSGSQTIKTSNSSYSVSLKPNTTISGVQNYKIISISDGDLTSCQNNNVNTSVDLNVTPGTKVNKVFDINVCVNEKSDTIEFTGGVSGTNYEWYSNNITVGVPGSGIGNIFPFFARNNSGSTTNISRITVIPSVGQCKGDTMKFDIIVRPKPKAKINAPNTVCPGDSILLAGVGQELKYVWTPNVSCITCNPVIAKPIENTTYKAFVTDKYNCFDSTEFDVVVFKRPQINIDEPVVCGEPALVTLKGKDNNLYTYNKDIKDGVPFMPEKGKTDFVVTVKDNLGCKNSDTVSVYVVDKPLSKFSATPEYGLASDMKPLNVLLNNSSVSSNEFEWYFRNGEESPLVKNTLEPVTALYKKPGIYVITLISKNGKCIDSSSISIKIDKLDTPRVEIAPNVFTPDNDGTNDAFFITVKNAKDIHVMIFNRWGNPIFEMTETSQSWDGKINGKDADEGVYYYQYEIIGSSDEKVKGQGYVQLIRK